MQKPAISDSEGQKLSDIFLFQKMKIQLNGQRFQETVKIQTESQVVLGNIMKWKFQETLPAAGEALGQVCKLHRGLLWRRQYWSVTKVNLELTYCPSLQNFGLHLVQEGIKKYGNKTLYSNWSVNGRWYTSDLDVVTIDTLLFAHLWHQGLYSGKRNLSVVCSQLASRFQCLLQITGQPGAT